MKIQDKHFHTIWLKENNPNIIQVIDQRKLPFQFEVFNLKTVEDTFFAIKEMVVRGAPLIGVTAAYGMYLALLEFETGNMEEFFTQKANHLKSSRPTAVNLAFAVDEMLHSVLNEKDHNGRIETALQKAHELKEREIRFGNDIGEFGLELISYL